jgi:hypothetical protein
MSVVASSASVRRRDVLQALLWTVLIAAWGLLLRRFGEGDVYSIVGPYALAVIAVVAVVQRRALAQLLAPSRPSVLAGLGVGVAMTVLTYPAFWLASELVPSLSGQVADLYRAAHSASPGWALAWVIVILAAEEFLWRGAIIEFVEKRGSVSLALSLSLGSYALAQLGTGSWLVAAAALVCGAIWTLERHFTRSLVAPILSHLIWTPTVIVLWPVV